MSDDWKVVSTEKDPWAVVSSEPMQDVGFAEGLARSAVAGGRRVLAGLETTGGALLEYAGEHPAVEGPTDLEAMKPVYGTGDPAMKAADEQRAAAAKLDIQPTEHLTGGGIAGEIVGGAPAGIAAAPFGGQEAAVQAIQQGGDTTQAIKSAAAGTAAAIPQLVAPEIGGRVGGALLKRALPATTRPVVQEGARLLGKAAGGAATAIPAQAASTAIENTARPDGQEQPLLPDAAGMAQAVGTGALFGLGAHAENLRGLHADLQTAKTPEAIKAVQERIDKFHRGYVAGQDLRKLAAQAGRRGDTAARDYYTAKADKADPVGKQEPPPDAADLIDLGGHEDEAPAGAEAPATPAPAPPASGDAAAPAQPTGEEDAGPVRVVPVEGEAEGAPQAPPVQAAARRPEDDRLDQLKGDLAAAKTDGAKQAVQARIDAVAKQRQAAIEAEAKAQAEQVAVAKRAADAADLRTLADKAAAEGREEDRAHYAEQADKLDPPAAVEPKPAKAETKAPETATAAAPSETTNKDGLPIKTGENVGLAAAMADDGRTSLHDKNMPDTVEATHTHPETGEVSKQPFNLTESRDYHERVEDAEMQAGKDYYEAHRVATEAEHSRARQLGFDPNEIEKLQAPHIDKAAHEARARGDTTAEAGTEPYRQSGEAGMREDGAAPDNRFVLDRDGSKYTDPVHGKLLKTFETVTAKGEDGRYAVIDPNSGKVLARGDTADEADAAAQALATARGRIRMKKMLEKEPALSQQQLRERHKDQHPEARIGAEATTEAPQEKADAIDQGQQQGSDEAQLRGVREGQDLRGDEAQAGEGTGGQAADGGGSEGGGQEQVQEVAQPGRRGAPLTDDRLQSPAHRAELVRMADNAGWAQIGGELIRTGDATTFNAEEARDGGQGQGDVTGRTPWVPNEPWFADAQRMRDTHLRGNKTGSQTREAVRKALAGEPMRAVERRHVQALLDEIDAQHTEAAAFHEEGINPTEQDQAENALIQHAIGVDPDAVEAASVKFEDDTPAFMAEIKRISDENAARIKETDASPEGEDRQAGPGDEGGAVQETGDRPAADAEDRPVAGEPEPGAGREPVSGGRGAEAVGEPEGGADAGKANEAEPGAVEEPAAASFSQEEGAQQGAKQTPAEAAAKAEPHSIEDLQRRVSAQLGREVSLNRVPPPDRAARAVANAVRRMFGRDVVYFKADDEAAKQIRGVHIGGNKVFINIDASKPHSQIIGHELLHSLRDQQPDVYNRLVSSLSSTLNSKAGKAFKQNLFKVREERGMRQLPYDQLHEELIAEVVGDHFADPAFIRELQKTLEPELYRRVLAHVADFLDKARAKFTGTPAEMGKQAARFVSDIEAAREAVKQALSEVEPEGRRQESGAPAFSLADQKAQTETPEFNKWFGDSKVVDEDGKPKVVYHGTNQNFAEFSKKKAGANTNSASSRGGFFFTESPAEAGDYAGMSARKQVSNADEAEANATRLLKAIDRANDRGDFDAAEKLTAELEESEREGMSGEERGANTVPAYLNVENPMVYDMAGKDLNDMMSAIKDAKKKGHDGLRLENVWDPVTNRDGLSETTQWVAFKPEQIKSAIGNRGTFDPKDPRIAFSLNDEDPTGAKGLADKLLEQKRAREASGQAADPYASRLEKQRALEGLRAAMRDPETGKIYTGRSHQGAIDSIPPSDKSGAWGRLSGEWDRGTDNTGFVNSKGEFISRTEAEKNWHVSTMEDVRDAIKSSRSPMFSLDTDGPTPENATKSVKDLVKVEDEKAKSSGIEISPKKDAGEAIKAMKRDVEAGKPLAASAGNIRALSSAFVRQGVTDAENLIGTTHRALQQHVDPNITREQVLSAMVDTKAKTPSPRAVPPGTGIAHRVSEARGIAAERGQGTTPQDAVERGREALKKGADPEAMLEEFGKTGKISADMMSVARAHDEELARATNTAADKNGIDSPQYKAALDAERDWINRIKPMQTEWHRLGQAQQGEADIDTGTVHGLERAFVQSTGKTFTPDQRIKAVEKANAVSGADAEEQAAKKDFKEAAAKVGKADPELLKDVKPGTNWTPEKANALWNMAKKNYIDKGVEDFNDVRHGLAADLGVPVADVTRGLAANKSMRKVTNEMYAKTVARRRVVNQAKEWLAQQKYPAWYNAAVKVPKLFFSMATFGHGTVGMITHAGNQMFNPLAAADYWRNFREQFRLMRSGLPGIGDRSAYHEQMMGDLVRDKNYVTARRAGLANDPFKYSDDYQNKTAETFFGKIGRAGNYGFDALKLFRQDRFNRIWGSLPENLKTPEMAASVAESINHATGITKSSFGTGNGWVNTAFFAPKLEASRWAFLFGDPAKAARTFTGWGKATPEERYAAVSELRNKALLVGTYLSILSINQGLLYASGSSQKVNFTDPSQSDWLSLKAGGQRVGIISPLISTVRFLYRLTSEAKHQDLYSAGSDTVNYLKGKLSPFAKKAIDVLFAPKQYDQKQLPWSHKKGVHETYPEYLEKNFLPIPFADAAAEIWKDKDAKDLDAESFLKAMGIGLVVGGTGAHVQPDTPQRAVHRR